MKPRLRLANTRTTIFLPNGESATLRQAQTEDAAAILALKQSILRPGIYDALLPEEYSFDVEQEGHWIEHCLRSDSNFMVVAEVSGVIVGMLFFQTSNELRCNHWGEFGMGITESYRGKGIGTELLKALFEWAEAHPRVEKICLKVFDANPKAVKLYQNLGFIEEGRLKKCLRLGNGLYSDAILMAKFVKSSKENL